jgi:hypothetical protein
MNKNLSTILQTRQAHINSQHQYQQAETALNPPQKTVVHVNKLDVEGNDPVV